MNHVKEHFLNTITFSWRLYVLDTLLHLPSTETTVWQQVSKNKKSTKIEILPQHGKLQNHYNISNFSHKCAMINIDHMVFWLRQWSSQHNSLIQSEGIALLVSTNKKSCTGPIKSCIQSMPFIHHHYPIRWQCHLSVQGILPMLSSVITERLEVGIKATKTRSMIISSHVCSWCHSHMGQSIQVSNVEDCQEYHKSNTLLTLHNPTE